MPPGRRVRARSGGGSSFAHPLGDVADANAEFGFEVRDGLRRDIRGPVVDVEAGARFAAACRQAGESEQEVAAVHHSRTRSEMSRTRTPNSASKFEMVSGATYADQL